MASITLTITDKPGNKVTVVADPSFETLMKMNLSGEDLTSAHGYALLAMRAIREASKRDEPLKIWVPRISRA